jgi:hypothetical protein
MDTVKHVFLREEVKGIAIGLALISLFTFIWSSIGNAGLAGREYHTVFAIFFALIILFIYYAIRTFRILGNFPVSSSEEDLKEGKKMGKWFGIVFGLEGITIPVAVNIVIALGHTDLIIPTIALIVGLHFYPMAWIFKRKIDYYLATWSCLIALAGYFFVLKKILPESANLAFVGFGMAVSTAGYGLYMVYRTPRSA